MSHLDTVGHEVEVTEADALGGAGGAAGEGEQSSRATYLSIYLFIDLFIFLFFFYLSSSIKNLTLCYLEKGMATMSACGSAPPRLLEYRDPSSPMITEEKLRTASNV